MKISFIDNDGAFKFDPIELDSRIPLPREYEKVLLKAGEYHHQFEVTDLVHSYSTETIFVYVSEATTRRRGRR